MRYVIQTVLFLVLVSEGGYGQNTNTQISHPNILFIMVDDLRPELGCYGKEFVESPNIDRLAQRGQLFARAYVNYPVCGPSRASLLSGLYASRSRFQGWNCSQDLDVPGLVSLPMHFKNNGYKTVSLGKVYNNFEDGRGSWDEIWRPATTTTPWDYQTEEGIAVFEKANKERPNNLNPRNNRNLPQRGLAYERAKVTDITYNDGRIGNRAIEKLQEFKNNSEPFFLAVGFQKPHLPFNAPDKYWAMYDSMEIELPGNMYKPEGAPDESMHNFSELRSYQNIPTEGPLPESLEKELIKGYYACVSYVDAQIGRVLNELENLGLEENTIIVLWGDHGWQLGEHDLWCKHANFSTSLQIPLLFKVPGMEEGKIRNNLVESVDIYPTLCDLAGLNTPIHTQGKSIENLIRSEEIMGDEYVFCRSNLNGETVITRSHSYTEFYDRNGEVISKMLFNLMEDPDENINTVNEDENNELVNELSAVLAKHIVERDKILLMNK